MNHKILNCLCCVFKLVTFKIVRKTGGRRPEEEKTQLIK